MKESIRDQRVRRHDARALPIVFRMHRRCVLNGIDRALREHRFLDALIVLHRHSLDPGHESGPPELRVVWSQSQPPGRFAAVWGEAAARLTGLRVRFDCTGTASLNRFRYRLYSTNCRRLTSTD